MIYCTVIGNWGDALAAYSNICDEVHRSGVGEVAIIYYGFNQQIVEFLANQNHIGQFIISKPPNLETYSQIVKLACESEADVDAWFPFLGAGNSIPKQFLRLTHVTAQQHRSLCKYRYPCFPRDEFKLNWSRILTKQFGDVKPIMVHPFSTENTSFAEHFPYWMEAMDWLRDQKLPIVVTGMNNVIGEEISGENVLNLLGKTESMEDVFALTDLCDKVIATSNCLSMYCAMHGKKSLVMKNARIDKSKFFSSWIDVPTSKVLSFDTKLGKFTEELESFCR